MYNEKQENSRGTPTLFSLFLLNLLLSHICVKIPSQVSSLWQHRQSPSLLTLVGFPQVIFHTAGRCANSIKQLKASQLVFWWIASDIFLFFYCIFLFVYFFITIQHFYEKLYKTQNSHIFGLNVTWNHKKNNGSVWKNNKTNQTQKQKKKRTKSK